ncbi:MAG: hypothetical protein AAF485_14975, partial [Chloroflexota bacterium]
WLHLRSKVIRITVHPPPLLLQNHHNTQTGAASTGLLHHAAFHHTYHNLFNARLMFCLPLPLNDQS